MYMYIYLLVMLTLWTNNFRRLQIRTSPLFFFLNYRYRIPLFLYSQLHKTNAIIVIAVVIAVWLMFSDLKLHFFSHLCPTEYIKFESSQLTGWIVCGSNTTSIVSAAHTKCEWFTFTAWTLLKSGQRIIVRFRIDDQRLWIEKYAPHQTKGVECRFHIGNVPKLHHIYKCAFAIPDLIDYFTINDAIGIKSTGRRRRHIIN